MLEMLFENPFIIIILIGLISSLFGRSKAADEAKRKQAEQRQKQTQTFEEQRPARSAFETFEQQRFEPEIEQEPEPKLHPMFKHIFPDFEEEKETQIQQEALERAKRIEKYEKRQRELEEEAKRIQARTEKKKQEQELTSKRDYVNDKILPETGSRLVDGIIYAEILGQPRAKRAHSSRRF